MGTLFLFYRHGNGGQKKLSDLTKAGVGIPKFDLPPTAAKELMSFKQISHLAHPNTRYLPISDSEVRSVFS